MLTQLRTYPRRIAANARRYGPQIAGAMYLRSAIRKPARRLLHRVLPVAIDDCLRAAHSVHLSALALAGELLTPLPSGLRLDQIVEEHELVRQAIDQRRAIGGTRPNPEHCDLEVETGRLLYLIARALRPQHILETGVANGYSTAILLSALRRNGEGTLHSTDVHGDVGVLVDPADGDRWQLTVLDQRSARDSLRRLLASMPPIDLFIRIPGRRSSST